MIKVIKNETTGYVFVGAFTARSGTPVNYIAKNSPTNVLDTGYRTNTGTAFNGQVIGVKKDSKDRLLCVGEFTSFNGVSRNRICRLNSDGTLDTTFNPGSGLNSTGHQINVDDSTGLIYASGTFTSYNGVSAGRFVRLLDNGTLDSEFTTNSSLNNYGWGIEIEADHVYVAGAFTTIGGISCLRLAKLNKTTGALASPTGVGLNDIPWPIKTDPLNSNFLIVGGNDGFTSFNGVTVKSRIVRVNKTTWAADTTFNGNVSAFNARVSSLDFDDLGKIILGGSFTNYNSTGRNFFLKLNSNGTLDTTFNPTNPSLSVRGAVFYPVTKKIGIHGSFTNYAGSGAARGAVVVSGTGVVDSNFNSQYTATTGQDNWTSVEVTGGLAFSDKSRRKGIFMVGESTASYGPTTETGFYSGIEPVEGGYTLYLAKESQGPSIYSFSNGTGLLDFCNQKLGADQTTVFGVINWINDQSNYFVDPNYFEFTVKTDNSGASTSTQFSLPLISSGAINFLVDWGDNSTDTITTFNQAQVTHTYSSAGTYTIKIAGILKGFRFGGGGDRLKFLQVKSWGCLNVDTNAAFTSCSNMTSTAVDSPRITTTNFDSMFSSCGSFNGNIGNWDVSVVTNMNNLFLGAAVFNNGGSPSINNWNVGNVTTMSQTFRSANQFNQPLGKWNMGKVTNMFTMLQWAYPFNQDLSEWDTSSATNMHGIFYQNSYSFPIGKWNTSKATTFSFMLSKQWFNIQWNHPVGDLDITNLTSANQFINTGAFSTENYDDLLVKWSAKPKKNNVTLGVSAKYSPAAASARATLVNTFGWTIIDNGPL